MTIHGIHSFPDQVLFDRSCTWIVNSTLMADNEIVISNPEHEY